MKKKEYEVDIEQEIEKVNNYLEYMANSDLKNFRFIRNEEDEKKCIVTYQYDCDDSDGGDNIKSVSVILNPFSTHNLIENLVVGRLQEKGYTYDYGESNERLRVLAKNIDVLASKMKIPEPKE